MKTLILAAIRCSLMFTAVAALSYPISVQAVPTTYQYTGNPFTIVSGPYTTSDFVTVMLTLAGPLPPNFTGTVTPTAFTFSDGVQTITQLTALQATFVFTAGPTGQITSWNLTGDSGGGFFIGTLNIPSIHFANDRGFQFPFSGRNINVPGTWTIVESAADTGSTLSLMTLTLMALGVAARRFKRAAA